MRASPPQKPHPRLRGAQNKTRKETQAMIKKCINPHCDEIAHNIQKKETRCRNCGYLMVEINQETYDKKFRHEPFQIDYSTGKNYLPQKA